MKKWLSIFSVISIALSLQSCEKEEDAISSTMPSNTGSPSQSEYVQCKIDGVDFLSKDDDVFNKVRTNFGQHQLIGTGADQQSITLYLFDFDSVGVYPVGGANNVSCQWLTVNPRKTYDCSATLQQQGITSGEIEVTYYDGDRIEGSFEFTAVAPDWSDPQNPDYSDKVRVTEGTFKLNYD